MWRQLAAATEVQVRRQQESQGQRGRHVTFHTTTLSRGDVGTWEFRPVGPNFSFFKRFQKYICWSWFGSGANIVGANLEDHWAATPGRWERTWNLGRSYIALLPEKPEVPKHIIQGERPLATCSSQGCLATA